MGVIYKIISPSDKLYVGKTYDLRKRINAHKCAIKYDKNIILHNSIRKYGWDAHKLEIIETVNDELLDEREMFWVGELKTYCYENPMGLNMTKGGDGQRTTWMHDIERRKKQSERLLNNHPRKGVPTSDYTKKLLSDLRKEYNKKNNIRVPEWGVKKSQDICSTPVIQYDLNGDFIKEYSSINKASISLNISTRDIWGVCNSRRTNTHGFVFKYKTSQIIEKIEVVIKKQTVKRPIICFINNYQIEYPSALEASIDLKIPKTTINRAAMYNNGNPIRLGYVFLYKDKVA